MRTDEFVIGYHAATAGRLVRFVVGVLGVYVSVWWMTQQPGDIGTAALAVAVAAGFYALMHRVVLWRPIAVEPWIGTSSCSPRSACCTSTLYRIASE